MDDAVDDAVPAADALAANRANWDERVPAHLLAYDMAGFVGDPERISDVVHEDADRMAAHLPRGCVAGLELVHLQCHIGTDTLSWARSGAAVTGVDFSPAAVAAATQAAAEAGLPARFLVSDVDGAPAACGQRFDVVYTSIGVLPWLPDLTSWAAAVAALLRPGGLFYLRDSHPVLHALDADRDDDLLVLTGPCFPAGGPQRYDGGTTYADPDVRLTRATTYEWTHPLSEVVQCLLDAGLRLTSLAEHRTIPWRALPQMVPVPGGWALPDRDRLPLTFSLTAVRQ